MMSPALRKAALVGHVLASVGWLGSVLSFLVLAVLAQKSSDLSEVRSLYIVMDLMGWGVLVPLAVASLITGLIQALGTPWGLLRHWWVIVKLGITVIASLVLLAYTSTLSALGDAARAPGGSEDLLPSFSPVLHAGAALVVLGAALALSIFKPRGMTEYGWRRQERTRVPAAPHLPSGRPS